VVGRYGSVFGKNSINIADMTFSRKMKLGMALVGINLDQAPPQAVIDEIRAIDFVESAHHLYLPELPTDEKDEVG